MIYQENQRVQEKTVAETVNNLQPNQQAELIPQSQINMGQIRNYDNQLFQQLLKFSRTALRKSKLRIVKQKMHNQNVKRNIGVVEKIGEENKALKQKIATMNQQYQLSNKSMQDMISQLQKQLALADEGKSVQQGKIASQQLTKEDHKQAQVATYVQKTERQKDYIEQIGRLKQQNSGLKLEITAINKQKEKLQRDNDGLRSELQNLGKEQIEKQKVTASQIIQFQLIIKELNKKIQQTNELFVQKTNLAQLQLKIISQKDYQTEGLKSELIKQQKVQKQTQVQTQQIVEEKQSKEQDSVDSIDQQQKQKSEQELRIQMLEEDNQKLKKQIKQMEIMSHLAKEQIRIMNENIRSKQLEMFQLKTAKNNRIQQLQSIICSREEQLYQIKTKYQSSQKPNHLNLPHDYRRRQQSGFISRSSRTSSEQIYCEQDKQEDIQQAELEILKCKYKLLQKMYLDLKNSSEEDASSEKTKLSVAVQVQENEFELGLDLTNNQGKSVSNASEKPLKKTLTDYNIHKQVNEQQNLDISIAGDSVKGLNKNSTLNSPQSVLTITLNSFFTSTELEKRIKNFEYNNSILHKVNSSKFITNASSKIAFIIQYACFLELYFSSSFLATVLEEMIMGEDMEIKELKSNDLSVQVVERKGSSKVHSPHRDDSSFYSQSSSKALSSSNLNIMKQLSMNSNSNLERIKDKKQRLNYERLVFSQNILPNGRYTLQGSAFQQQLKQLQNILSSWNTKKSIPSSSQICERFKNIAKTAIGRFLSKILTQNEAMKKCINLMLKNEEAATKNNNQIYFQNADQDSQEETAHNTSLDTSNHQSIGQNKQGGNKEQGRRQTNCSIM